MHAGFISREGWIVTNYHHQIIMTRINLIPVTELADQHLMAEYRELPMIMGSLKRTLESKDGWQKKKVSPQYTLNKGHVYFFTNKKSFLVNRFAALVEELKRRKYNIWPEDRVIDWNVFDPVPQVEWTPTEQDVQLNMERITARIAQKPEWYRWTNRAVDL